MSFRSRRGATKVEYALMVLLVSLVSMLALGSLGRGVSGLYDGAALEVAGATGSEDAPGGPVAAAADDDGAETALTRGRKKPKRNANRGQPGTGNNGNEKLVGNAGD